MSLSAWIEHRTVSLHEAAEVTRKLASALQAIHSAGIRHRDIKASNVMIDERGEPLLMDFGLARLAQADTHVTQSGSLVGTPAYMAPEQIQLGASGGDERSDLYSLGVLLYQMLTGHLPFEGPMTKVLVDIATKEPPRLETLRPGVDADLATACRKAMSREQSARYQTATEFESALERWLHRSPVAPRQESQASTDAVRETDAQQTNDVQRASGLPVAERQGYVEPPRRNRKATKLIAAAFLFALAAAIVIKISDRAELVITSPEPGLEVKVVQLADNVDGALRDPNAPIYTLHPGENSVRVRSGQVEVVLTGANADEYEVLGEKITLKRFGREVVEIKRRPIVGQPGKADLHAAPPSPWDDLDPAQIPESERVPRQPEGLVAVLGQHRRRVWNLIRSSSVSPDGTQFTLTTDDGLYLFGRDPKQPARFFPGTSQGGIYSATYLPDGRMAGFGPGPSSIELQIFAKPRDDTPLEKQSAINTNNGSGIFHPIASSDGRWLAAWEAIGNSDTFSLWRLSDSAPQRVASFAIPQPHGGIQPGSFSPDSQWFCFADENAVSENAASSAVHLIDLRGDTPREATVLKADADEKSDAPAKGFWQAVFLSDGRLATADKNGRTWFWKLNDGEPQRLGSIPDSGLLSAASQGARLGLFTGGSGTFNVWDHAVDPPRLLGKSTSSFALDNIGTLTFSPNGETVFTAHHNGAVRFWNVSPTDVSEADPLLPNPGHFRDEPFRIVDNLLCTTKESGTRPVAMWRPTRNGMQSLPDLTDATAVLDAYPARKLLAVQLPGASGANLLRRDGERWKPIRRIPGTNISTAAIDSSGQRLAIRSDDGPESRVELWGWEADELPAKKLSSVNVPAIALQLAFAEAGRTLIGRLGGFQIQIWDVKEDQLIPRTKLPQVNIHSFAVSPDGSTIATTFGLLELWNLKSDLTKPTSSFSIRGSEAVAFSPDGRRLAASFWENGASAGVQIINLATGVVEKRLTFPGRVLELAFTDDNRHLITGNANATIYVVRLP